MVIVVRFELRSGVEAKSVSLLWYNRDMIKFTIITLFPEAVKPYLEASMMWKATEKGLAEFELVNLRDFGLGPHKSVDDTPYGGGDGMLLRCEPVFAAIESVKKADPNAKVILPTPVGEIWDQDMAKRLANRVELTNTSSRSSSLAPVVTGLASEFAPVVASDLDEALASSRDAYSSNREEMLANSCYNNLDEALVSSHYIILCPHYEGYDERILTIVDYKISLGKYVLTGGELPALIIIDSVVRLIPGVLGGEKSAEIESFSDGDNLEYPQYTRPEDFRGMKVPEVLLSGNHGEIAKWREKHSGRA